MPRINPDVLLIIRTSISLNSAFASEYDNLIANSRIDAWIYGHSHTNIDTEIGGTRVISNQMGYIFANEHLMNGFESGKFIEIK